MMDGRNCTGRRISLLNESSDASAENNLQSFSFSKEHQTQRHQQQHHHHHRHQLPPLLHRHSTTSSSAHSHSLSRTPSLSPQTPQLVRSNSSAESRTPSPLTPPAYATFGNRDHHEQSRPHFEHRHSHSQPHHEQHHHQFTHHRQHSYQKPSHDAQYFHPVRYGKMDDPTGSHYPPIPDASAAMSSAYQLPQIAPQQPMPAQPQSLQRTSTSPSSEPSRLSTASVNSGSKPQTKKNQYPCPMAKQVGCTDFFTTSGHAARHAKKHTGKKDAFCPECNKAFTRKDNMEQHRRTHQNGRGAARTAAGNDDAKVKKNTKQTTVKKAPSVKAESQLLEAAVEQQLAEQSELAAAADVMPAPMVPSIIAPPLIDQNLLMPAGGPYYLGPSVDSGPVPPLPMALSEINSRPPLLRSSYTDNLGYVPPSAPMIDPESLHYSYPSPGLSNGLSSLALAASETQRLTEKPATAARSPGSDGTPSDVTP